MADSQLMFSSTLVPVPSCWLVGLVRSTLTPGTQMGVNVMPAVVPASTFVSSKASGEDAEGTVGTGRQVGMSPPGAAGHSWGGVWSF